MANGRQLVRHCGTPIAFGVFFCALSGVSWAVPTVTNSSSRITVDNGLTAFEVNKSNGRVDSLTLGGQQLVGGAARGYFSSNVGDIGVGGSTYWEMGFAGTTYSYATGPDFVDVALFYPASSTMPFDVTQHYVLRDGETGFHVYAEVEHTTAMDPKRIEEMRFVLRGSPNLFTHHWVADDRHAVMPTPAELSAGTNVIDATDRLQPGTAYEAETGLDVYTKYDWSVGMDEADVFGIYGANYGAWIVQANKESLIGGPTKQELTVHQTTTTPVLLGMLVGQHYGTPGSIEAPGNLSRSFAPMYVHLNSGTDVEALHADALTYNDPAVHQAFYDSLGMASWVDSADRSTVTGMLHFGSGRPAEGATVMLTDNDTYHQYSKYGHQYWTTVEPDGSFDLSGVRPGTYRLSAYRPGTFGEFYEDDVTVGTGPALDVGDIAWQPPDHGVDLWQIGTFDRTATEFRHGADNEYRNWDVRDNYVDDFPDDVLFAVGQSDEATDWNFVHWERATDGHSPVWTIQFETGDIPEGLTTSLTIAVAGQQSSSLRVRVNGTIVENNWGLAFSNSVLSRDGIRAGYQSRTIQFNSSLLNPGTNTITLAHPSPSSNNATRKDGIIYDALRLEIAVPDGDYNADGVVDAADYVVWRKSVGSESLLAADGNSDGIVDQLDYGVWRSNFGHVVGQGASAGTPFNVPEPSSLALIAWAIAIFRCRRRFDA